MSSPDPRDKFFALLDQSLDQSTLVKLVLAKPAGGAHSEPNLERINIRQIDLRGTPHLSFVYRYTTRDITKNLTTSEARATIDTLLGTAFKNAHLHTTVQEAQLAFSKKGRPLFTAQRVAHTAPVPTGEHNREKQRWLPIESAFLTELGVTTTQHTLVPAMARKWKQINKFIEVFAHALDSSTLADAKQLHVADFGCGKGYLTFAIHQWLNIVKGIEAQVTGVELRPDMVALCNGVIDKLHLQGLHIEQGDVRSWWPQGADQPAPGRPKPAEPPRGVAQAQAQPQPGGPRLNVVIALHACDIATDYAIHLGIRAGAEIILCSPCCHKQVRPQLLSPHPIRAILQHGIHADQEAEMLTDGLRALLLEAAGYDTKVFEFISLEHTNKNKMILAVKRKQPKAPDAVLKQIAEIKQFYGIREQALESLLKQDGLVPA